MTYKKKTGVIICKLKGFTPFWIDAINAATGAEVTIFTKNEISDKFKKVIESYVDSQKSVGIIGTKMGADNDYKFKGFSHYGARTKVKKIIAHDRMMREIESDYNPVRGKGGQKLVTGRAGLPSSARTGNKINRALSQAVSGGKEIRVAGRKRKDAKTELLIKLRRKFFNDRALYPDLTDRQWDTFLLENADNPALVEENSESLKRELEAAGIL